jgi:cobyrinic acid a,c-diamide synthase
MYLGEAITDGDGKRYPMCGCFPLETQMLPRLKALGYREIRLQSETLLGIAGQTLRGHEFHYSEILNIAAGVETVYRVAARSSEITAAEGFRIHNTLGSYIHLHFGSRTAAADAFVQQSLAFRRNRGVDR